MTYQVRIRGMFYRWEIIKDRQTKSLVLSYRINSFSWQDFSEAILADLLDIFQFVVTSLSFNDFIEDLTTCIMCRSLRFFAQQTLLTLVVFQKGSSIFTFVHGVIGLIVIFASNNRFAHYSPFNKYVLTLLFFKRFLWNFAIERIFVLIVFCINGPALFHKIWLPRLICNRTTN